MINVKISDTFEIYIGDLLLLKFVWPVMGLHEFTKIIKGDDVEDQNDEGIFVKMKNKVLNIKLYRGDNDEIIEINL